MDWFSLAEVGISGLQTLGSFFNSSQEYKVAKQNAQLEADTNKWITEQNIKSARELAEYQNEYNTEMWHKQNEYNSPANQMRLYKEAGINPAAVYGNIGSSAATAQGVAGITPDFSHGYGAKRKVAYKLPDLSRALESAFSVLSAAEDLRKKRIDNDLMSRFGSDYYNYRNLIQLQTYLMNGGSYKDGDSDIIRRNKLLGLKLQNQMSKYNVEFQRAKVADHYLFDRPMMKHALKALMNKNWEYDTIHKPYLKNFGQFEQGLNALTGAAGRILGLFTSFLKIGNYGKKR